MDEGAEEVPRLKTRGKGEAGPDARIPIGLSRRTATHHDDACLIVGQHDCHQACGWANGRQDVLSLHLPVHLGHVDKGDL